MVSQSSLVKAIESSQTVPEAAEKLQIDRKYAYYLLTKYGLKIVYKRKLKVVKNV